MNRESPGIDRRRFIVTGISAAAVGATLASDACAGSSGGIPAPAPPASAHRLVVQYAVHDVKGYKLRTRTYNGRTKAPTIETRPGETLVVQIVNRLPPNPPAKPPRAGVQIPVYRNEMEAMEPFVRGKVEPADEIDRMNNPHGFNTTNLHVHGIQTVPHIFYPLGTSEAGAPMLTIDPGKSFTYTFPVPPDHPSGLHWYHPHKHGSTDVQVSGGMAGLLVVRGPIDDVPEIAAAREIFVAVQTLNVNPSKKNPNLYEREYLAYKTPADGGYWFATQYTMLTVNGEGAYWIRNATDTMPPQLKPLGVPEYVVKPGEVVRLRILNATNSLPLLLALSGFDVWQIGFDGVNTLAPLHTDMSGTGVTKITPETLFSAPIQLAAQGSRIELLVRAPSKPGTYALASLASERLRPALGERFEVARLVVAGSPATMSLPATLPKPTREYPIIGDEEIVVRRTFLFGQGPRRDMLTGRGFTIDGVLYQEMLCPTRPKVGTCEEWRIENETDDVHPFHLHENSFQLFAINDVPVRPVSIRDTFAIPQKLDGVNGSLTIRVRFKQWYGKTVFHCHAITHEDTGMMQNVLMT